MKIKEIAAIIINDNGKEEIFHVAKSRDYIPQLKEMIIRAKEADKKGKLENRTYRIELFN